MTTESETKQPDDLFQKSMQQSLHPIKVISTQFPECFQTMGGIIVECKKDDQIVGFMTGYANVSLAVLEVHPNHRKQGIATYLVKKFIQQSKILGCKRVQFDCANSNTIALHLYEKLGFQLLKNQGGLEDSTLCRYVIH